MNNDEAKKTPADALDYKTQNLGYATFDTDPSRQSASFKTGDSLSANYQKGDIVGNSYRLLDQIGRGGMGVVYLAEHVIIGQQYALKLLAPNQVTETNWARFEIEGRALARIDHPNIVKIFNMGIDQRGCPFYVMDFLKGRSLHEEMEERLFKENEVLAIYTQVCAGLGSAHKNNIVHRDVKPSNIMLTGPSDQKGTVKIVDFGIASMSDTHNAQTLTTVGEVFGSPLYMSPEQCAGEKVDARSDIYSLGCSLFHSLTGRPPFTGASALETLTMHVTAPAPTLASVNNQNKYSEALEQLVAKLLMKNPVRRYQTMEQVYHDIERIAQGKPIAKNQTAFDKDSESLDGLHRPGKMLLDPDMDKDQSVDDKNKRPKSDENLVKLAIAIVFALGIIAAAALGINGWIAKNKAEMEAKNRAGQQSAQGATTSDTSASTTIPFNSEQKAQLQSLITAASERTQTIVINGRKFHVIVFPNSFSAGALTFLNKSYPEADARGIVRVPEGLPFTYNIDSSLALYPAFLEKLASEHIYKVRLKKVPGGAKEIINHLATWPKLNGLHIYGCEFAKNEIAIIDKLPHLFVLELKENGLDQEDLTQVKSFEKLTALQISGQQLAIVVYERLARSKGLKYVEFSEIKFPPNALRILATSRSLDAITIHSDTLSDDDIKTICSIPQIASIDIKASKLDEQCAKYLLTCKHLSELTITTNTIWSEATVQRLHAKVKPRFTFRPKTKGALNKALEQQN